MSDVTAPVLPLTLAQRGLWVGHKIAASEATMVIAEVLDIRGPLDAPLFVRASAQLAQELEAARIRIIEIDGIPWQTIRERYHGELPLLDFSDCPEPWETARAWMLARCGATLDLAADPLWSCALIRLGVDHHAWYQQAHHVVYDGFSGGLAARRISEIYTSMCRGEAVPACGFGAYADLVAADQAYRSSPRFVRDRDFWCRQLAGLPEAVSLSRHGRHRGMGGLRRGTGYLDPAQVEGLSELGRRHAASLPQVLIALVAIYYHRMTGVEDLVIGMPVAGRVSAALRAIPGMMANAVAIRLQFGAGDDAASLLQQVSRVVRQALRHQQYRYEDVRRDLGLLGQDRHMAWLGVNIEPFDYRLVFGEAEAVPVNLSNGSVEDLTVFFYERGDGRPLRFDFDANPALYGEAELQRHAARLLRLTGQVLADPQRPLSGLDLLTAEERDLILGPWRGTPRPPAAGGLPARVAAVARRQPQAVAVRHRQGELRYAELQQQVEMVAALLSGEGVQPGDRVAVALPREPLLIAALLAVLRLGATYVPLDPEAPPQRTAWVMADARPRLLLCEEAGGLLAERQQIRIFPLAQAVRDFGDAALLLAARGPVPAEPPADAVAYLLYTSGSTGHPKGVEITHANLSGFLEAMQIELQLRPQDRFLAQTTLNFDIAALELYLPLLQGASVVLAGPADVREPRRLAGIIADQAVTHVQATPSLWRMLLSARQLRLEDVHVLVGGEALSGELAAELWQRARRLSQLYGPTETTIWSTIEHVAQRPLAPPPIGRPLANTRLYVLDEAMRPVPAGVAGELCIGGSGVARGYAGQPGLTADRFVPDPFLDDGSRLYRSGDRVRWGDQGHLEFLGRSDGQVKIRGHRVEPGEIEQALERQPSVAMAAVSAFADERGEPVLAAYVTVREGYDFDAEVLRQAMADYLPAHMMPASLQRLAAMPLTPSGKLDRKALPAPERQTAGHYVEPLGPLERQLATLWQEIFGRAPIGRHDNFFELGGDSLTAAQMMTRLSDQYGLELPLGHLFEAATVAGLAARLQGGVAAGQDDPLAEVLCLRSGSRQPPLFCIHPVIGIGWGYAALLPALDASIPVYCLQASGLRAGGRRPQSLEAMAEDYLQRVRSIQPAGPVRLLGWSLGGLVAHAMAARLEAEGGTVELLGLMDAYPFAEAAAAGPVAAEAQDVEAALQFLGLVPDPGAARPQCMAELADYLCRAYDLQQLPLVQSLQQDDPELLPRIASLVGHHLQLARRHVPSTVAAGMLYFQAVPAASATEGALGRMLQYRPAAWEAHTGAAMDLHVLACSHQQMLDPPFAAEIGRVLDHALARDRRQRDSADSRHRGDALYA